MPNSKILGALSLCAAIVPMSGCKSVGCSAVGYCPDGVTLQFQPAIVAKQEVVVTLYGDDASYSDTYSPTHESGNLFLDAEDNADAGTFAIRSARLDAQTPSKITFNVTIDGNPVPIAQGTVTPQYQRVSKGPNADCMQNCTQAQVTVQVAQ